MNELFSLSDFDTIGEPNSQGFREVRLNPKKWTYNVRQYGLIYPESQPLELAIPCIYRSITQSVNGELRYAIADNGDLDVYIKRDGRVYKNKDLSVSKYIRTRKTSRGKRSKQ